MTEVSVDAMTLALLKEVQVAVQDVKNELDVIRKNQQKNSLHLKYEVVLSIAHTDFEIADFDKMNMEINALTVMPVPSAISLRLRGLSDETIDLDAKQYIDVTGHLITRLLVTNSAGTGTAKIHVFGKQKEVVL